MNQLKSGKSLSEVEISQSTLNGIKLGILNIVVQKAITFGIGKFSAWKGKYTPKQVEEALEDLELHPEKYGLKGTEIDATLSIMLKNADFKKIYENLSNGNITRVYSKIFSIEEEALIRFYQEGSYYNFNQALINKTASQDILTIEKMLNKTLDKIPSKAGNYFRGVGKEETLKLLAKKEGGEIGYDNFLSSSSEKDVAWGFLRKVNEMDEKAFITVISKNGKNLESGRDVMRGEFEMLHKSKTKFEIEKIEFIEKEILNIDDVAIDGATPDVIKKFYLITIKEL
nr:hypothetical protein [uncultured Flavobacterium sp.]